MRRVLAAVLLLLPSARAAFASCESDGRFDAGAAKVELKFDAADYALSRAEICDWAGKATGAVLKYYGRFPVAAVRIVLKPASGKGVSGGTTFGHSDAGVPLIVIRLGRKAERAALGDDWVMTHELTHLSVPEVPDDSHWLEEGIATYVEPVARVQAGQLPATRIWGDMRADMWKGTPAQGDAGLDRTHTWGRTYWGGALFCLFADVAIRERTQNKLGLQDALRGVLAAGGSIEQRWSVGHFIEVADRAVGVPVLAELYGRMGDAPGPNESELDNLWKELGVERGAGPEARLLDDAPLATARKAITAPR